MKILMMLTADYAAVEQQTGKLNIIGVFNSILATEFPTTHYRMYLALKFEGDWSSHAKRHRLLVTLADETVTMYSAYRASLKCPLAYPE